MKPVLIADSEEHTREALKSILANHVPLIVVESEAHALNVLSQKTPVALVFMGVVDGDAVNTEVFSDIRGRYPELTVITVADHANEELALEAVRQGATGYMIKPFKKDEVLAMARKAAGI